MISDIRTALTLTNESIKGWVILAVIGSVLLAGLDTLGVAAMLPLMALLTTADVDAGVVGTIADFLGVHDVQTLVLILAALVAICFIVKSVASIAFRWWLLGHTATMTAEASTELMRRYVLDSYMSHRQRSLPETYRNIGIGIAQTFNQVILGLLSLMGDLLVLVMLAVVLLITSPLATLFAVVLFAGLTWGIQAFLKTRQVRAGQDYLYYDGVAWAALMAGFDGFREARLASASNKFVDRFSAARFKQAQANRRSAMYAEVPRYALEIGFIAAVIGMASILFATGTTQDAISVLAVFAAASLRMLPTLNRVTANIGNVRAGQGSLKMLAPELRKFTEASRHNEVRVTDHNYSGDVVLDDVSFKYPGASENVLDQLNLTIKSGETTAIVGSSGAGKSTLLDLVLGLHSATSGRIMRGGVALESDLVAWFESISLVPQDVYLLDDSLEANIAFGIDPENVDPARLASAISAARLDKVLAELPEGLQTRMGERGARLSGGQRQRVGIARALYREPSLLVLDEATSALDNEIEHEITKTIDNLRGQITVLIVAHRLSTVRHADRIIFMKDGRVAGEGTFELLRKSNADFARLVELGDLSSNSIQNKDDVPRPLA